MSKFVAGLIGAITILLLLIFLKLHQIEMLQVHHMAEVLMKDYISAKEMENGEYSYGFVGQVSSGTATEGR